MTSLIATSCVFPLLAFGPGPMEMLIIGVIAVLLFGKRLPEVARSAGRSLIEFKKGMHGIEDELRSATNSVNSAAAYDDFEDRAEATAPKFEPPPADASQP